MADPMTDLVGTDGGLEVMDTVNANFAARANLDFQTLTALTTDATINDEYVELDASSNAVTYVLDSAVTWSGRRLWVHVTDISNTVTLDGDGTNINGSGTKTVSTAGLLVELYHDGTEWFAWTSARL